jgi:hypothetical protein
MCCRTDLIMFLEIVKIMLKQKEILLQKVD